MGKSQRIDSNGFSGARVLAVDDQKELLDSLSQLLSLTGFEVDTALGGKEAINLLEQQNYHAVLLDLQMPDLSGHHVLHHISLYHPDTQTIIVSGETSFDSVKECLKEGAYDYVRKPYIPDELLTTLGNALKARQLKLEHRSMEVALRDSEKLHRYIVDNSPDIVYMLDDNGLFTFVNQTMSRLLKYDRDELVGMHYSMLVHEDDIEMARYIFNERRTGNRSTRNAEIRLCSKGNALESRYFDTHILPVELNSTGIYNSQTHCNSTFVGTYGVARDITYRKKSEELINFQAYHDLLTGLPNRALFNDRLQQAITTARRKKTNLAVMFLDLDRFKNVNDSLGHAIGDLLLQSVAERLKSCLRDQDTLCRFGGDEFTLLLPEVKTREDAALIANKVLDQLSTSFVISGHELTVTTSIGISMFPEAGDSIESLCQKADIAMYYVKANGKDGFQFFTETMNHEFTSRVTLEREIRQGLDNHEFQMFFQPKVNSESGQIVGMESLVRWQHPVRGLVMPGEFIQLAEDTNLIVPLGNWALRATCEEMARWKQQGIPPVSVSVNVSAKQLQQADFVRFVLDTLRDTGIDGRQIELEITENTAIHNTRSVVHKLLTLANYGIRVAIDDFGMGYSSLSYLRQFPVHTLKIDRNFVGDIDDKNTNTCIVNAIIALAKGLNLHLVAEGVENLQQLEYLKDLGCTEVQGHFFAMAQSADNMMQLLADKSDYGAALVH